MRRIGLIAACVPFFASICVQVDAQDRATIIKRLEDQYTITKATADKNEIVTAGSVLVLLKDNLMMDSGSNLYQNTYKGGRIVQNTFGKVMGRLDHLSPGSVGQRTYVAGEKMWLTKIDVFGDAVSLELLTDAINGQRYHAALKFPFPAKGIPKADDIVAQVAEVFKAQPFEEASQVQAPAAQQEPQQQVQQPAAAAAPSPEIAPIAPPPPPVDAPPPAPKTLSLGQSQDEVVAILGQPDKIAKLGTKQIYYYKDLKVTFLANKVTDVQ